MIIIPAIDLKDGQCVRLVQGNFEEATVYSENPVGVAELWQRHGAERIHVVDLDGSLAGAPRNREIIREIVNSIQVPIQVGGGIRDIQTVELYLEMGVRWVIIGSMALMDRNFVMDICRAFKGKIILGIDAKDGNIAIQGWTEQTSISAVKMAKSYDECGLEAIIYTDIKRDGMETGVNIEATKSLAESIDIPVIASGGVSGMTDIEKIMEVEKSGVMGIIIGKALYTGAISLEEAISRTKNSRQL